MMEHKEKFYETKIRKLLERRGWATWKLHGSKFQSGLPDLLCSHKMYGIRFVEVKKPKMAGSSFTPAQIKNFPKMLRHGCGVWVICEATELEYQKLFKPPNYMDYRALDGDQLAKNAML